MNGLSLENYPIVCTHGWKHDRHVWSKLIDHLPPEARVETWDLPHHGQAEPLERPDDPVRHELVERLDEVVRERSDTSVILAGHSLGGYVSLSYALEYPDRVAGLVLLGTGPGFSNPEAREKWNQWARDHADPDLPGQELLVFHHDSEVLDRLRDLSVPTLVLVGERDTRFSPSREVFEARIPNVESHVIAAGGHNIHLKHPDVVAQRIVEWASPRDSRS